MTQTSFRAHPAVFVVAVTLAAVLHLLVGFLYLVSGLAVPGYALIPLWVWWILLTVVMVRLATRRSWWSLAVPVVAFATWKVVLLFGDLVLGWTA